MRLTGNSSSIHTFPYRNLTLTPSPWKSHTMNHYRPRLYPRDTVENYPIVLDIFCLKSLLRSEHTPPKSLLTWKREEGPSNRIEVMTTWDDMKKTGTLRVVFTMTDKETGEIEALDYEIPLVATSCQFWGKRWWFLCPKSWNRCAKLYLQENGIFASRKSLGLKYSVQNIGKRQRQFNTIIGPDSSELDALARSIKYSHRQDRPTRKFRKYEKISWYRHTQEDFYWVRKLAMMSSW
jgi:hypothetical protein